MRINVGSQPSKSSSLRVTTLSDILDCPLKLKPDREQCSSEQVGESSFWMTRCSSVESTGSCGDADANARWAERQNFEDAAIKTP